MLRINNNNNNKKIAVAAFVLGIVIFLLVIYIYNEEILIPLCLSKQKQKSNYSAVGAEINGRCHSQARFGPPSDDGGWNICMQPSLLETECKKKDYECQWRVLNKQPRWPPENCIVYSFGSSWDFEFELAISRLGCEVHTFDPTMPSFITSKSDVKLLDLTKVHFHNIGLGDSNVEKNKWGWKVQTVDMIMKSLGHSRLEILKIDIEKSEWPVLDHLFFNSDLLKTDTVRQIVLETHYKKSMDFNVVRHRMKQFEKFGFYLWARDDNLYCPYVQVEKDSIVRGCLELSYIRKKLTK